MSKIKLNVLGISYSQTQSGAYALVLSEEDGARRIPIIVGGFEAQSIAIQLEGLNPPRPLTHDLFLNFANAFKISILEVVIYKLEEGVFYSKLVCDNGKETISIDSRTSDAIALSLRFGAPIYTTSEIIDKAGVVIDFATEKSSSPKEKPTKKATPKSSSPILENSEPKNDFNFLNVDELKKLLEEAISKENYERASKIRDEINKRDGK